MEERVFDVSETIMNGKFNTCLVCDKRFKKGEKIVLCPIQKPKKGWASVMSIPIHVDCYYVDD